MNNWKGNSKIFRTYVAGVPGKKKPVDPIKGRDHISSFEDVSQLSDFGGILQPGIIDISFDDQDMSERFLKMAEACDWRCLVLMDSVSKRIHTFWRDSYGKITKKSDRDRKLAVGLIADIHGGDTYIPLRLSGVDRFPPVYDIFDDEDYQEIPEELYPVNTKVDLWDLKEGGRNNALSGAARYLSNQTYFGKRTIMRILTNTNRFVFAEPLPDSEVEIILRDETFRDVKEFLPLEVKSAAQLYREDISPVEFIVEGLIPVGLTILASPPKYGKSWMCLDLSLSVAAGTDFLGFTTNQCGVLYLALEDRFDRLKQRMTELIGKTVPPEGFLFAIESAALGEGFIEQTEKFLKDHPEVKLIIVDTFVKVRGEPKRNESAYKVDSREAGDLKHFADRHGVAVLLVTHVRKFKDMDDPFVNISGTYGIAGAADDLFVLSREKRDDEVTRFSITGRDVEENDFAIVRDPNTGRWIRQSESYENFMQRMEIEKARLDYMAGNLRKTLKQLLDENDGSWTGSCGALISKSREFGTPITLTSQQLGKQLFEVNSYLLTDGIMHTEISRGVGQAKRHKFEKQ